MNWDSWSRKNCVVLSLAADDIDGDGREEILVGCADRHVYALDADGSPLWRSPCQWGPPVCLDTVRLEDGPERQTLAGLADPAIHAHTLIFGKDGTLWKPLRRPDIVNWSIPSWSRCLRVADVDGDGRDEVISGVDTNHRQLIVYGRDGDVIWDADAGGAVLAAEVRDGRLYAGASNGFVQCFDAAGSRLWRRLLVEPVAGLAPAGDGGCLAALVGGRVVSLDGSGEIRTTDAGDSEVTVAGWPSGWPDGGLLVGRKDGALELFR
ncbi:MAG: PQQ-binding-like beta-propeller repeat protein [Gemmatimonadota bacterium]|nr:PQQ-binding-like beta-propeller repeat protein [Gemmatimonadota bacterium]